MRVVKAGLEQVEDPSGRRQKSSFRRPEQVLGASSTVVLGAALLGLFLALTVVAALDWSPLRSLDTTVGQWGYDHTYGHPGRTDWWLSLTNLGQPFVLRLLLAAAAAALAWLHRWRLTAWLLATAVVENVVAPLAKFALSRPRPHWNSPITVEHGLGYPSGHAAAAGMLITASILLALVAVRRRIVRTALIMVTAGLGLLIAASRIFLGVHYLTDVLAGLMLGTALTLFTWWVLLRYEARHSAT